VQKRDVVIALRTGQQATVHKYRDAVTKLENLMESRRARLTVSQESLQKELYLQLIKHVSLEPSNIVVSPENCNAESVSSSTMNKTFLQEELLSRDSLESPEDEENWQKYQSKWTRLVQTVAGNVYEQAVSPTAHQCAVLERVVQGYQRHLGLEASTGMEVTMEAAMEVEGGVGDQELESTNMTTTTSVASPAYTPTTDTLNYGATSTGFMDDGDTGNTGPTEFTGMHPPAVNDDSEVDQTVLLPMTVETAYAATEYVQE
jgi:hypothetical protein